MAHAPVARPQVLHLRLVQGGPRILSLMGRQWSVLQGGRRRFESCCGAADFKVVLAQVFLLAFVKLGAQLARVALVVELHIRLRQVVVLHLEETLRSLVAHVEVRSLDRRNEVLVGRLDGQVRVFVREQTAVGAHEAKRVAPAELHRSFLGLHLSNGLLLRLPAARSASNGVVGGAVLLVLGQARADAEVGHLVFGNAVGLLLSAALHTDALHLVEARLRIVNRAVLAEDKVGSAELIDGFFALVLRSEAPLHAVSLLNLALEPDVRHFSLD